MRKIAVKNNQKINLIYITGGGHSGSTLVSLILGTSEQILNMGELKFFNQHSKEDNQNLTYMKNYCSCGEEAKECPFWSEIESNLDNIDVYYSPMKGVIFSRIRRVIKYFFTIIKYSLIHPKQITEEKLLNAVFSTGIKTNKKIEYLLDNSKSLDRLIYLNSSPQIDVKTIHIVRDGRGYLNSYKKINNGGFFKWILDWLIINISTNLFTRANRIPSLTLSYNKFCQSPKEYIKSLESFLEVDIPENYNQKIRRLEQHLRAGNPMRTKLENFEGVHYSRSWQKELSFIEKVVSTIILAPFNYFWVY